MSNCIEPLQPAMSSPPEVVPHLVLGGAPKCGTGTLFQLLCEHPRIMGSTPKEPFYFMDPDNPLCNPRANYAEHGLERYRTFFPGPSTDGCLLLDATTHYLYQQTAMDFFAAQAPQTKLVFLLRQPAERILSSFLFTRNNTGQLNPRRTFPQYVERLLADDLESWRGDFASPASYFVLSRELQYSRYVDYLQKWVAAVGRSRLRVFLFEDLIQSSGNVLQSIWQLISLEAPQSAPQIPRANPTIHSRWPTLHRMIKRISGRVPERLGKRRLAGWYRRIQDRRSAGPDPGTPRALARLDEYFSCFNEQLQSLLDLDVAAWRTGTRSADSRNAGTDG